MGMSGHHNKLLSLACDSGAELLSPRGLLNLRTLEASLQNPVLALRSFRQRKDVNGHAKSSGAGLVYFKRRYPTVFALISKPKL